jgi:hypothetical protein
MAVRAHRGDWCERSVPERCFLPLRCLPAPPHHRCSQRDKIQIRDLGHDFVVDFGAQRQQQSSKTNNKKF